MGINVNIPEQCEVNRPVTMNIQPFGVGCELVVIVSSTGSDVVGKRWQGWDGKRPVDFELIPRELGLQYVEVELFHGTSRIGYIIVEAEIREAEAPGDGGE